jgi:hypothetical protein
MKHLVPLARANPVACDRLVAAIAGQGLTNREVGHGAVPECPHLL